MPDNPTPDMLKRLRTDEPTPSTSTAVPPTTTKGKPQKATVEDFNEEEDVEREEPFAPGNDADYFAEEDEEGRFFGGGLTDEQKQILSIFEGAEGGEDVAPENLEELNITGIRKMLQKFDRAVKKNQDQRSKYPDDPTRFIDSEADLDGAIKSLLPLAQSPSLAYPELVKSGVVEGLVDLLSHENVDIVIDVVELIHELTDEDVGEEGEGDDDDEIDTSKKDENLKLLIDSLLSLSALELLVSNLSRYNESEESDRQGVYHTLGIFENSIAFDPSLAETLTAKTPIFQWLLERLQWKAHDENRGYVGELLAILLQGGGPAGSTGVENRRRLGKEGGIDVFLKVLAPYRKRDPVDADETEFMENVFDALCLALTESSNKKLFLEGEGIDLMVIMMKEKKLSQLRSIKVLDHAMSGNDAAATTCCETFVDALGLGTLFSAFMNKGKSKSSKAALAPSSEDTSYILGILSSLFSSLPSDSPPRIRLLLKFTENDYEKVDRLIDIREQATSRLKAADRDIELEFKEMVEGDASEEEVKKEMADVWYLNRLDRGLFTLQTVDYILGWICMEDDGIRAHVQLLLGRKNKSIQHIVSVLQEFHDNMGSSPTSEDGGSEIDGPSQKMILEGLIGFLESC